MFNADYKIGINNHNKYTYKILNENGEVIDSGTYYNTAKPGLYITEFGSSSSNSTSIHFIYTAPGSMTEQDAVFSISFEKITDSVDVQYGTTITYEGNLEISSNQLLGSVTTIGLGRGEVIYDEGVITERNFWSETSSSFSINEKNTLIITVRLFFEVSVPSGLTRYYNSDLSSLLNKYTSYLPTPGVRSLGVSSLPLSSLPNPLNKLIPTFMSLPTIGETDTENLTYSCKNPVNVDETSSYPESLFLPSVGIKGVQGYNEYSNLNCGIMNTLVLNNVGAVNFSAVTSGFTTIIPAVKLYAQNLRTLYEEGGTKYFYCATPACCDPSDTKVVVDNTIATLGSGLGFIDPATLTGLTPVAVALNENDTPVSIDTFIGTNEGSYYANYLFGGYWEPSTENPICPRYLYFNTAPKYIVAGGNISCTLQGLQIASPQNWMTLGTVSSYEKVAFTYDESLYSQYRLIVSAPNSSATNFYLNETEKVVIPKKSYDPMILRIGDVDNNFTHTGISVTHEQLGLWLEGLAADQSKTAHTLGIQVTVNNSMFKTANTLAYMQYSATTMV